MSAVLKPESGLRFRRLPTRRFRCAALEPASGFVLVQATSVSKLMQSIGANAYRFSVAWPRIFPEGTGQANPKGLNFYSRLVDELLPAGIKPFATLYHCDLPQALPDRYGGWQSKDSAKAFADYAWYVAEHLGDRVKHYFTVNEFASFAEGGYQGTDVPDRRQ